MERKGGYSSYWAEVEAATMVGLRPVDELVASQLRPGTHDVEIRRVQWSTPGNTQGWCILHFEARAGRRISKWIAVPSEEFALICKTLGYDRPQYGERLVGTKCRVVVEWFAGYQLFFNSAGDCVVLDAGDELLAVHSTPKEARAEMKRLRLPEARLEVARILPPKETK